MARTRATTTDDLHDLTTGSLLPQEPPCRLLRRALELLGAGELGQPMIEMLATDEQRLRIAVQGLQALVKDVGRREAAANAAPGTNAGMSPR
jgi:hypothetical protein